ncbi:DUF1330 domain-containing protein [Pseudomonas aeruginosa]|nr:DUF1330 domain-containing protein [Pseudomonas aeruginosa]
MVTTLPSRRLWRDPAFGGAAHRRGRNLAFPDDAGRRDWYDSPAYQTIAAHRFAGSRYRAFIIEGRR